MALPQQMTRLAQRMVDSVTKKMVMKKKMVMVWAQRMVDSMTKKKKKMMNSMTMKLDVLHLQHPHPLAVHHRLRREKQTNDIIAP
jgi:hypothetical protein